MMTSSPLPKAYRGYRFPGQVIAHAVWLYLRFPLNGELVFCTRACSWDEVALAAGALERAGLRPVVVRLEVDDAGACAPR